MRAVWYERVGPARVVLQEGERPTPQPLDGEVRVRLHASGVNPSDVKARAGARGPLAYPYVIPHSDGAGVIDAVGRGIDSARIGKRVWTWNAAWRRPFGTCGQYVCLPTDQVVDLPDDTDFAAGSCLGIPAMTACHAVLGDGSVRGQTVLITGGAGAVGHYAIQFAKWSGAHVITTVSSEAKRAHALAAGADDVIDYRNEDVASVISSRTAGAGVDRIVEVEFGGNLSVSSHILKCGGVIAAYGSMASPEPKLPFYPLMFKNVTVHCLLVYILSAQQRAQALQLMTRALLQKALRHAIGARFDLAQAADAHLAVESSQIVGNVVIDIA